MPATLAERRAAFRKLHEAGCFVIPNPWDIGTARYLAGAGFKALATTSAGAAFPVGRWDGGLSVDQVIENIRTIVEATDLPVNADFEDGHAANDNGLAQNIRRCIDTGVAGLSIEDATGDPANPLYDPGEAVHRLQVARATIDASGADVMLVGRADGFFAGKPDLDDVLKRLAAFSEAGADILYAPGITTREQIQAVVETVAPRPVNVLVARPLDFTVSDLAALGVRRISVGSGLAASAWGGFMRSVEALQSGSFDAFAHNANTRELGSFFRTT